MDIFTEIKKQTFPRNKFDLSFDNKLTTEFGRLTPMLCKEMMPGDSIKHRHELFLQFMPLNSQMMHRFYVRTEYFYVPHRLVYEDFNKFLTGGEDGTEIIDPPYFEASQLYGSQELSKASSLADYLGMPTHESSGIPSPGRAYNSMPFRSYQLIYNEWYRDENLIDEVEFSRLGGKEDDADLQRIATIRHRAWRKDYFTSSLPWPQKGPQVVVPIADVAYVYPAMGKDSYAQDWTLDGSVNIDKGRGITSMPYSKDFTLIYKDDGSIVFDDSPEGLHNKSILQQSGSQHISPFSTDLHAIESEEPVQGVRNMKLVADLRHATALSIEELRRAFAVQEWLELNAIGGTRDVEMIHTHFGVKVPDYRLGRPQYVAGYSQDCSIGNVYSTQNSDAQGNTVQAYPVSTVQSSSGSDSFTFYAHEHGYLIGIVTVVPRASYFQGVPRMFGRRKDKFDYYWPKFAQLGFQPIYADEIYQANNAEEVFGYTPRYAEFKFSLDEIHGAFRDSLQDYHDSRIFPSAPNLNQEFIEIKGDSSDQLNRIFNYTLGDEDHILIDIYHHISKVSSMVYFGTPRIM